MCGQPLDEAVGQEAATPEGDSRAHPETKVRRETEPPVPAPAYTGGIFNLGAPADKPGANLDYLLEDDEPRSRKGLVVGLLALVLVVGLGYLRWHGNLPWPKAQSSGTKNTAQPVESPADGAGPDQSGGAGPTPSPAPAEAAPTSSVPPAAVVTAPATPPATAPGSTPAPPTGTGSAPAAGCTAGRA